jgi:hypothetical protein
MTELALLAPFAVVVWGADEAWRWRRRRHQGREPVQRDSEVAAPRRTAAHAADPGVRS